MKPYYEHAGITIYHGDCRDVLPHVHYDVLVTDPPYGLAIGDVNNQHRDGGYGGHLGKGSYESYEDTYENFCSVIIPALTDAIKRARRSVVFTGPHIHEQLKPDVIGGVYMSAATGRTPWGSKNFLPILFYGKPPKPGRHRPIVLRSHAVSDKNGHPCPKPIAWMRWAVAIGSTEEEVICDTFCGSGSTLSAAKELGRQAIGIEIEERYCEIAAKRLSQEVLDFSEAISA